MALVRSHVALGDTLYLVFKCKRFGDSENIIFRGKVVELRIKENLSIYVLRVSKCMNKKDYVINKAYQNLCFDGSTINTGLNKVNIGLYPVFTTKEKCLSWIKGL